MEGALHKWTNPISRWQERYFILSHDILTYCETKNGPAKGQVHLKMAAILLAPNDHQLFIINTGTAQWHIRANSIEEKILWVSAIKEAQNKCLQTGSANLERRLSDLLSAIWLSFAQFDEDLSILQGKVNSQTRDLIEKIMENGNQLKTQITLGLNIIQEEKDKLSDQTVYESFAELNEITHNHNYSLQPTPQKRHPVERRVQTEEFGSTPQKSLNRVITLSEALEPIKQMQPIKYKNLINNPVFTKLKLSCNSERDELPFKQDPKETFNVWPFLKSVIGKDLTRIPVPLIFHQPLSALQMVAQTFEYFDQIQMASNCADQWMRMCHIIAFAISKCVMTLDTTKKPFNPLLGETYEFVRDDYWIVAEQVSHHPPVSGFHCEGPDFIMFCQSDASIKFGGTSIKLVMPSQVHLKLKKFNDHYTYSIPTMLIKNLIFGEKYFEHVGDIQFKNHKTGDIGFLRMQERNWDDTNYTNMYAEIKDKKGVIRKKMHGFYNSQIFADNQLIWERRKPPKANDWYYSYTHFLLQANYLNQEILQSIPCTDSRLRPDIVALECGWKELGQDEKSRLEQKQRDKRTQMEQRGEEHVPRFFKVMEEPITKERMWIYLGNYWSDRSEKFDIY